jgi:acetyl/propionyl-CoA carboxylase alpha subunit
MNTRLQVEHPVTEAVTGLIWLPGSCARRRRKVALEQDQVAFAGHAIEARLYAEDPYHFSRRARSRGLAPGLGGARASTMDLRRART